MKKKFAAIFCFVSLLTPSLSYAEKENALYEKIFESYLKEDYATVERLAPEYAKGQGSASQKEDILNLRALSLLKLGREAEGLEELRRLEGDSTIVP